MIITADFEDTLSQAIHRAYLEANNDWQEGLGDVIDWQPLGKALQRLSCSDRIRIHKHLHPDWLATNNRQHRMNAHIDHRCPRCQATKETSLRVLQCSDLGATAIRTKWCIELDKWLEHQHTAPSLSIIALEAYRWLFDKRDFPVYHDMNIRHLHNQETDIGRPQFFRGYLTDGFRHTQDNHFRTLPAYLTYSGERWTQGLITRCGSYFSVYGHTAMTHSTSETHT